MYELFTNIEMPVLEVLADMQYRGMYVDKNELIAYGDELKGRINELTEKIHELAGEEFNINSTKQLGEILFEKLKLPVVKKTKRGKDFYGCKGRRGSVNGKEQINERNYSEHK